MQDAFAVCEGIHRSSISELIASPNGPVVQIAAGLCFFEKTARVEDPVISLEPQVTTRLPSDLGARSVSDKSGATAICSPDKESGYGINAVVQALSPLEDPVERQRDIVRSRCFHVRMNVD